MSLEPLYSSLRTTTVWSALILASAGAASAQGPQGPITFEQIIDSSFSGRQPRERANDDATIAESIHVDPMLGNKSATPPVGAAGNPISLGRLKNAPPPKALRQMQRAQEAFADGDSEKGIKRLEQAIEIHPNYIEARNNLGVRYSMLGRWADAAQQFEKASDLDPAAALPHLNLAVAMQALGDEEAAVLNAEEAVRLAPHDAGMYYNLGAILAQQGRRLDDAVRLLSRAEAAYPKATLIKVEALLQMGASSDAQKALRDFLAHAGNQVR